MKNNNDKISRIIKIALPIMLTVVGAVYAYGKLNGRFVSIEAEIKKVDANENAIIGIQKDLEYLKEAVDEIKELCRKQNEKS